ncbi:nucleotidyltransferase family protein [Alteromonas sediminis]|uniref:Nucleotidyltransferase family protein n=1 Tax=Alteromonas sediminis TaxID=2259342 RepID=A0A3N5XYQ1_9ALTE|nr:nucleotidyltransferase family protein [Alteromonas sediminis]RPJ66307.1 nucleotidyltransferase family protein [Alteromonas sediminis]
MYSNYGKQIAQWVKADTNRLRALNIAAELNLPDWCLAAGFVRNLVWDNIFCTSKPSPLNDLDLIYFDKSNVSAHRDKTLEQQLRRKAALPWSVKNQARMHLRNGDKAYSSTVDAMRYWIEKETAVGVRLNEDSNIEVVTAFDLQLLFAGTVTLNDVKAQPDVFADRIATKNWLTLWPKLKIVSSEES